MNSGKLVSIGSMYGIFTYTLVDFYNKCRQLYQSHASVMGYQIRHGMEFGRVRKGLSTRSLSDHTVDGSEIRRENHLGCF